MAKKKCDTPSCSNKVRFDGAKDCNTCHSRKIAANNPLRRAYRSKKSNAKRKGIPFSLTFEEFKAFAIETDYIRRRGRSSKCYVIDRIERYWPDGSVRGYDKDNIQVLINGANSTKFSTLEKYYDGVKMHWHVASHIHGLNHVQISSDVPF